MKISIGCDHRGFELKSKIIDAFSCTAEGEGTSEDIVWDDMGCSTSQHCDYPVYANKVTQSIINGSSELGVLICGSGIGMSIAANRHKYIYAGLCFSPEMAKAAIEHDNLNILVLSSDFIENNLDIVTSALDAWGQGLFKGGCYQERLDMIEKTED